MSQACYSAQRIDQHSGPEQSLWETVSFMTLSTSHHHRSTHRVVPVELASLPCADKMHWDSAFEIAIVSLLYCRDERRSPSFGKQRGTVLERQHVLVRRPVS